MTSNLSLLSVVSLFVPFGALAQSGTFTESSIFIGPKACSDANYVYEARVELDDYIDDSAFILRMVPSSEKLAMCPPRPVLGNTLLHSSKRPEAFNLHDLDLEISIPKESLKSALGSCDPRGLRDDGVVCLYAKTNGSREINLIAQTRYRIDTRAKVSRIASTPKEVALIRACENDDPVLIAHLLDEGVETEVQNAHGWRPLHIVVSQGNVASARVLLAHGADIEARVADADCGKESSEPQLFLLSTPLEIAARLSRSHMVDFLLKNRATPNKS